MSRKVDLERGGGGLKADCVYTVPFKVIIHTKAKELQYKILNKYLAINSF